jgi:hypothetical protein
MLILCIGLMMFGVGFFLGAVLLPGWLDERDDALSAWGVHAALARAAPALDSAYRDRVAVSAACVELFCAFCRRQTMSLRCYRCKVYYCTVHNTRAHKDCSL